MSFLPFNTLPLPPTVTFVRNNFLFKCGGVAFLCVPKITQESPKHFNNASANVLNRNNTYHLVTSYRSTENMNKYFVQSA